MKRGLKATLIGSFFAAAFVGPLYAQVQPGITASSVWIGRQTFCASGCTHTGGTYTPTSGTNEIDVTCVGGGGAGGGAGVTAAGQVAAGAGGGSAGAARKRITSAFNGVTVTIGTGGVAATGAIGGNGVDTTFGSLLTAGHGLGGNPMGGGAVGVTAAGGAAGTGTNGDINITGQAGVTGIVQQVVATITGAGGSAPFGLGKGGPVVAGTGSGPGQPSTGFGAGGSGGGQGPSQAGTQPGGAGGGGFCLVDEYR